MSQCLKVCLKYLLFSPNYICSLKCYPWHFIFLYPFTTCLENEYGQVAGSTTDLNYQTSFLVWFVCYIFTFPHEIIMLGYPWHATRASHQAHSAMASTISHNTYIMSQPWNKLYSLEVGRSATCWLLCYWWVHILRVLMPYVYHWAYCWGAILWLVC